MAYSGGAFPSNGDDIRCGVQRPSMQTNVLIAKSGLGETKKCTFKTKETPEDRTFGCEKVVDPEGAREVTSLWKEHQPNPDDKPGPDFRKMNKKAAQSGLTKASEQHNFRASNPAVLQNGEAVRKPAPPLPSDFNVTHVYGRPTTHRTAEECRAAGDYEPHVKHLVQGAYQTDWVRMNVARAAQFDEKKNYIKPHATKATTGHSIGASKYLVEPEAKETFKIKKFTNNAESRVMQAVRNRPGPGATGAIDSMTASQNIACHDNCKRPSQFN